MKNDIETLNEMAVEGKEIYLFPLENILGFSNLDKPRCKMEMLIDRGVAEKMINGKAVGALIIADKKQFNEIKRGET